MTPRPLELDFLRTPRSSWRIVGWALLGLAAVLCALWADRHAQVAERHAALQAQEAQLATQQRRRPPRTLVDAGDAQALAEVRRANAIIDQLAVPWEDLFDAVEASGTPGVGLLSMAPTARDRTLRLTGEAKSMTELLAYVERLGQQPTLRQPHLQGYSTVQRYGASVLSFTLVATWKGGS